MKRMSGRLLLLTLLIAVGASAVGCSKKFIKDTQIEDSERTRDIIRVMEPYRTAIENRDVDLLLALASPDYFEKNGDTNSRNNYDYSGLMKFLRSDEFRRITAVKMTIVYRKVEFSSDEKTATVTYNYVSNFKMPPMGFSEKTTRAADGAKLEDNFDEELWYAKNDENQMILENVNGKWFIAKGM